MVWPRGVRLEEGSRTLACDPLGHANADAELVFLCLPRSGFWRPLPGLRDSIRRTGTFEFGEKRRCLLRFPPSVRVLSSFLFYLFRLAQLLAHARVATNRDRALR